MRGNGGWHWGWGRADRVLRGLLLAAGLAVVVGPVSSWARVVSLVRVGGLDAGPAFAAGKVVFGWVGRDQTAHVAFVPLAGGERQQLWRMGVPGPKRTQEGLAMFSQSLHTLVASPGGIAFIREVTENITPYCRLRRPACGAPSQTIFKPAQLIVGDWQGRFVRRDGCGHAPGPFDLAAGRQELVAVDANPCGRHPVARVFTISWAGFKTHELVRSSRYRFAGIAVNREHVAWLLERRNQPGAPLAVKVLDLASGKERRLALPRPGAKTTSFFFEPGTGGLAVGADGQVALLLQRESDTGLCGGFLPLLATAGPQATRLRKSPIKAAGNSLALAAGQVLLALGGAAPPNCPNSTAMALVQVHGSRPRTLAHVRPYSLSGQVAWNGHQAAWYGKLDRSKRPAIWLWHPTAS
jgi:hypothetical protein